MEDAKLELNGYFLSSIKNKFRDQYLQAIVYLPIGSTIYLDGSTRTFINNIDNVQDVYDNDMAKHYYKMTEDGLYCLDCDSEDYGRNYKREDGNLKLKYDNNGVKIEIVKDKNSSTTTISLDKDGLKID